MDLTNFCTAPGLFRDPIYCQYYIECTTQGKRFQHTELIKLINVLNYNFLADGSLAAAWKMCPSVGGYAANFDVATKTCIKNPVNFRCIMEPF